MQLAREVWGEKALTFRQLLHIFKCTVVLKRKRHFASGAIYQSSYDNLIFITYIYIYTHLLHASFGEGVDVDARKTWDGRRQERYGPASFPDSLRRARSLRQSYALIEFTSNSFVQRITTGTELRTSLSLMGFRVRSKAGTQNTEDDRRHRVNVHSYSRLRW